LDNTKSDCLLAQIRRIFEIAYSDAGLKAETQDMLLAEQENVE